MLTSALTGLRQVVVGSFRRLACWAITHPRLTLVLATVVTLAAAPGLLRLKLRTDGHALVSARAPEVVFDQSIRDAFGIKDPIVVLIRSEDTNGIYNPHTLQLIRELTAAFARLPGVNTNNLASLATEAGFRARPSTLIFEKLLDTPTQQSAELERLRDDLRRIQIYTGTLVSADGHFTAILVGAPPAGDRTRIYEEILQIIVSRGSVPEDISVTGAPVAEALLGIHILEDLGVPQALLGTSTRERSERIEWRWPSSLYELRLLVARKIGLVPVAVVVMMLIFFASFRSVAASLLPLPEIGAVLVFSFGLMGWFGVPVYLTIAVMPVLLTAMCVTDEIHVFSRYFALLRERPKVPHVELVRETVNEMCCPVVNTTLTTAIGFVSFALSPLQPVQAFGLFTAIGVLFSLLWSLTVIPAMLVLIPPRWLTGSHQKMAGASPWFGRLAGAVTKHRAWVASGVLLVAVATPFGLHRLVVQDSWIDGFDPASEFRRATRLANEHFHGVHLLLVTVDSHETLHATLPPTAVRGGHLLLPTNLVMNAKELAGARLTLSMAPPLSGSETHRAARTWSSHIEMVATEGSNIVARLPATPALSNLWTEAPQAARLEVEIMARTHLRPQMLQKLSDLATFIREHRAESVGGVLGPPDYLATARFYTRPNDPNARVLPKDPGEIKVLWDFFRMVRGIERTRQVVDTNYARSLITVFLKDGNFIDTARLMADIRDYEREHLAPHGIRLGFAGDVAVSQSLINGIVTTQVRSLVWSLAGIAVLTSLLGRSLRWGFYAVLPSTLAVAINFAVMGWCGIPLGVATSMFAGMTLGIGVDFAIHVLEGCSLAQARGLSGVEAVKSAMAMTGPAVWINTLAISLGFGVLMLSQVPANARLGILVVLGLVDCMIVTVLLLPALLHWWPLRAPHEEGPESRTC